MSIINEALKKTEEQLQKNTSKNNPLPPKVNKAKSFMLYVFILLAGLLFGNFIFSLLKNKIQKVPAPPAKALAVLQTTNLPPQVASPSVLPAEEKKFTATNFVLNGIFYSDNDSYALVNNQIVRENDFVDGAKVGLITTNTVELDNAGEKITLSTYRYR